MKSQRAETGSLLTLFHSEPKPRNARTNPYWTFADITQKLSTKLNNLIYVKVETRYISGKEYEIEAYIDPTLERFLDFVEAGVIYVDFDARTGHNHGTKFRIRPAAKTDLYQQHIIV